jgi:AcrR family transcriptional regulator
MGQGAIKRGKTTSRGQGKARAGQKKTDRSGPASAGRAPQLASTSENTREKLLRAAMAVFAREGYAAATTRMIAAESGANLQAITYYFGGKGELYRAVVQHIADSMSAIVGPAASAIEARLEAGEVSRREARDMVRIALSNIARALLLKASDDWARIILREQMQPGPEFELLYSSGMGRMLAVLVRLTAIALERDAANSETRARALGLLGQVLIFRMARAAAFRTMGWEKLGPEEFALLEHAIEANTNAILGQSADSKSADRGSKP